MRSTAVDRGYRFDLYAGSGKSSCTVSVDVTSDMAGTHVNISDELTSSLGNSGPAMDSLRVFALDVEPVPANTLRGLMLMTLPLVLLAVWKLPRGMSVGRR